MKILVTGANGFIGSSLIEHLNCGNSYEIVGMVRSQSTSLRPLEVEIRTCNLSSRSDLEIELSDIDVVIHTAGKAHVMSGTTLNSAIGFEAVNTEGTLNLAKKAAASGVKRFIFLSSIKANGDRTQKDKPFTSYSLEQPQDPYGISKLKAENGLYELASDSQLEITIIRPPLVYGAGVKGNFLTLIALLNSRVPLPLGSLKNNRRSMVSLTNLISLLTVCIENPHAANKTFLVSDGKDFSTTELIDRLGTVIGKPARLFPCPEAVLVLISRMLGIEDTMQKLVGNLQVDITETIEVLDWRPLSSIEKDLTSTILSGG